ncbi:MAG: Sir2 family NAD-dependent protein deacetylase [Actinomycetaceae bacterium]|nr:Sir2 family NAD-dependent protein deacetylase [Actinomycetaceae bacterium]
MQTFTDPLMGAKAAARMMHGKKTVVVAGAGMSTDSGIPDYRGKGSTDIPTVDYDQFIRFSQWRRWVWYRNQQTWRTVESLEPTPAHYALKELQDMGIITTIATQNVDALDEKAGCRDVQLLHGTFRSVTCVDCGEVFDRDVIDTELRRLNPDMEYDNDPAHVAILASADTVASRQCDFVVAPCPTCGGIIKPSVVFFGEMLPAQAMENSFEAARQADIVLIAGTSLAVLTGLYVAREAWENGARVIIINRGPTSADTFADIRINAGVSQTLSAIVKELKNI